MATELDVAVQAPEKCACGTDIQPRALFCKGCGQRREQVEQHRLIKLVRQSAFRVLGLMAGASENHIRKAADKSKRSAKLGRKDASRLRWESLGQVQLTPTTVSSAMEKLFKPTSRLHERFFWIAHSETVLASNEVESGLSQILSHDQALFDLIETALADPGYTDPQRWATALSNFERVIDSDEYWNELLELDKMGSFEVEATPEDIATLRRRVVQITSDACFASIDVSPDAGEVFARAAHMVPLMNHLNPDGPFRADLQKLIEDAVEHHFEKLVRAVTDKVEVDREDRPEAPAANRIVCDAALKEFDDTIAPALDDMARNFGADDAMVKRAEQSAARLLSIIATAYTWANANNQSIACLERAEKIAAGGLASFHVSEALEGMRNNSRYEEAFKGLKPIKSAPTLWYSIYLSFGICPDLFDKEEPIHKSREVVYFLFIFVVPVMPLCRYRVIGHGSDTRYIGSRNLRKRDAIYPLLLYGGLFFMILGSVFFPLTSSVSYSPADVRSLSDSEDAPVDVAELELELGPAEDDATANSYILKNRLKLLRQLIDANNAEFKKLAAVVKAERVEYDGLKKDIDGVKASVKKMETKEEAGGKIDKTVYRALIRRHNLLVDKLESLGKVANANVDKLKSMDQRDSDLVDRHNAIVGLLKK